MEGEARILKQFNEDGEIRGPRKKKKMRERRTAECEVRRCPVDASEMRRCGI